ncbi:alpha-(1,6)-fucosyltransferase-like [Hydractinia symbiolongicarpus]|uniref:alpha-(1,6)-fucosyltransferase-like n=1 Tax=Hydractinia symbiolongicarpus TaxID=13093 RepID=UPI0025505140|nr:alpha-(1,6)-fucosyltransferase-like [Hydractinia symbiolongicarpus]
MSQGYLKKVLLVGLFITSSVVFVSQINFYDFTLKFAPHYKTDDNSRQNIEKVDFRLSSLGRIRSTIWSQIENLQEAGNCEDKRILHCEVLTEIAGFGSMMHRYGACMQVAYGLGRIAVIKMKQYEHFGGLERWLLPLSKNCDHLKNTYKTYKSKCNVHHASCYLKNGYDVNNTYKVLKFRPGPKYPYPRHIPGTIPVVIEAALYRLKIADPKIWFSAQFLGYLLLRANKSFKQRLNDLSKQVKYQYPIVSMHIRHGDKLYYEAKYVKEEKFLIAAKSYFQKNNILTRRIYVASDDKNIEYKLKKTKQSTNFKILTLPIAYRHKGLQSYKKANFSATIIESILVDTYFLTYSNYTICTYSSNICRLVHMLKQASQPDNLKTIGVESVDIKKIFYDFNKYDTKEILYLSRKLNHLVTYKNFTLLLYQRGELFRLARDTKEERKIPEELMLVEKKHIGYKKAGYVFRRDFIEWPGKPKYYFYT